MLKQQLYVISMIFLQLQHSFFLFIALCFPTTIYFKFRSEKSKIQQKKNIILPILLQILSDLANLPSYDARLTFAAEILDRTIHIGTENIISIAKRFHNKLLLAEKYNPSSKIQCETILFRVETSSEYSETIGHDYGLSKVRFFIYLVKTKKKEFFNDFQICDGPLKVLVIPGDHRTFLQGDNVKVLADQIITISCNQ